MTNLSAWDLTGAVFWTLLALMFFDGARRINKGGGEDGNVAGAVWIGIVFLGLAIFCVARLSGAHL